MEGYRTGEAAALQMQLNAEVTTAFVGIYGSGPYGQRLNTVSGYAVGS